MALFVVNSVKLHLTGFDKTNVQELKNITVVYSGYTINLSFKGVHSKDNVEQCFDDSLSSFSSSMFRRL